MPNTLISHLTVTDEQFRVVLVKLRFARHASKSELVLKMTYNCVIGMEDILDNNSTNARIIMKNCHKILRSLPDFILKITDFQLVFNFEHTLKVTILGELV